ncbi:HlyD family type I secretion periplasmic adaptor subunit [Tropicimonas sp. S265A]|uniref:HlyD family type I secretion periplasmic adaptor subunit n=1 Tax=Tropicimonas sp. S265A TaxID=3415134 RepID=UPI003C7ACD44
MFGARIEDRYLQDPARISGRGGGAGWFLLLTIAGGLLAFLIWAATSEIEEVARGAGQVVPSRQVQVVQSLEGGIITALEVAEGDLVEAGQPLVQISDVGVAAERRELLQSRNALLAEAARLEAEASLETMARWPPSLAERAPGAVAAELAILETRHAQLDSELQVLSDQRVGREGELAELRAEALKLSTVLEPLRAELALTENLVARGALPQIELLRLRGRLAEIEGDLAVGAARAPTLEAAIREADAQIDATRAAFVTRARQRLARVQLELAVVETGLEAATDRVDRTVLRAPARGIVNRIPATTIGAVVQPGAPVLEIVPVEDRLLVEADIAPRDVAFITVGEPASVKITAYDYLVYGALEGTVDRIGADAVQNGDGLPVFRVAIRTDADHLAHNGALLPIRPGMQAQVDIQTGSRTVLSYLLRPLMRTGSEALRER